jgi:CheY-like chemotaxis protein
MVVDDEEFCIESMKAMLFVAGMDTEYQVDFCIHGQEALDHLIAVTELGFSYKLIFTDFSMPVMDGI